MHLLIDGQALQTSSSRQRGIGRYSSNLLRALAVARPTWRIEVVQSSALKPIKTVELNGLPTVSFHPPFSPHPDQREINERYYADWLTAQGADGVLVLSHIEGWEAIVPSFCGPRPFVFGIAYDLVPLLYPEHYFTDFATARWYALRFRQLLQSDTLLAISAATARDVRALGGEETPPVVNIAGAADPSFAPRSPSARVILSRGVRQRFGLHREFLLYLGAPDYRKNLPGALRAFAALPPEWRNTLELAVVCRMTSAQQASFEEIARQAGIASSVRWITSATDRELRLLYQTCRLFFFPSFYEGMGLPVLEALSCGAPVVTSNTSSLPEYAGRHSWLVDPASPQAMAKALQQALHEPHDTYQHERVAFARTFSWHLTAERARIAMERSMLKFERRAKRRTRLAWVIELTGAACGLAQYATELVPHLEEHFDIEFVSATGSMETPEALSRDHLILTANEVRARHDAVPYDMFLYQLSPSSGYGDLLGLLCQFPGLVVLYSFSTTDLQDLTTKEPFASIKTDSSLGQENSARPALGPVLGVLVHDAEAGRQLRHAQNAQVVHLPIPKSIVQLNKHAAFYVRWIHSAIERYQQGDGPWLGYVLRCLSDCADADGALIDSWASLRARGQQRLAARPRRGMKSHEPNDFSSRSSLHERLGMAYYPV